MSALIQYKDWLFCKGKNILNSKILLQTLAIVDTFEEEDTLALVPDVIDPEFYS